MKLLRIVGKEPTTITRVQDTGFVAAGVDRILTYYGVCPRAHRIDTLKASQTEVRCPQCGRSYPIEDEEHL